jgi:hypothetical protein
MGGAMTYQLVTMLAHGRTYAGIQCLRCRMISYHPKDIAEKYCGFCHRFHEDLPRGTSQTSVSDIETSQT